MAEATISPEALQDMGDIRSYIAMDHPEAAERVVQALRPRLRCWQHSLNWGRANRACVDYGFG